MPYDKLVDSAQLDNAITQTANAIRAKTGSADLIDWNTDTGFADAIGSLGGASGGNVSYQSGYRINSSGEQIAYDGYATSDYISCELNNVVYLLNIYMESGVENAGNLRIAFYDSNKVHLGQTNATGAGDNLNGKYEATDGSLSQFTIKSFTGCDLTNVKYIRLCSTKLDGDSVVIVTESGDGSGGGDANGDDLAIKIIEKTLVDEPLPEGLTHIGDSVFYKCYNLALTSLPKGLTSIGQNAFYGCTNLALTSLPEGVTSIGNTAFYSCSNLALTSLPEGVTSTGDNTFFNCRKLALPSLPEGLNVNGSNAFNSCANLALTSLPDGVTTIGSSAFDGCSNLALTSLPEGLTTIGSSAFRACTGLTAITFKRKPINYSSNIFSGCTNLLTINVPWAEGEVANAPWGATNATINYNYVEE